MSRRKNKKSPAAGSDGNAVGVAPEGSVATVETADETVIEASNDDAENAETAVAEVDPAVLEMLADDSAPATATITDAETPEITADDVAEPTDDEVLAAIDNAKTPRKSGAKTPATIMRDFTAVAKIDEATLKANLDGINAKKVREKAENLIAAVQTGKKLSRYTADAVKHLKAEGRVSGKSLVEMFQAEGLGLGTARAQSQQMTALFQCVGLAAREDGSKDLVLQDNDLADELVKIAA